MRKADKIKEIQRKIVRASHEIQSLENRDIELTCDDNLLADAKRRMLALQNKLNRIM